MRSLHSHVSRAFQSAVHRVAAPLGPSVYQKIDMSVVPANPKFGDFQCNNAIMMHRTYGAQLGSKSPKDMGDMIAAALKEKSCPEGGEHCSVDLFDAITVAPAGFITVTLKPDWLGAHVSSDILSTALQSESKMKVSLDALSKVRTVAVDFSSPNIAKEMHVGHLRSTISGETISRILEFLGHKVLRINHVGDWGTQFGMLIEYMSDAYPEYASNMPEITDLQSFYKLAKARFDTDEEFKTRSQRRVVALQQGDKNSRAAWQVICEISRREFQKIYDRLGVTLVERGESYYNGLIPVVLDHLKSKGTVVESNGAQCIFTSIDAVPLMVVKSDGGYGYDSTDIATIFHRLRLLDADWLVYVTDIGQENHFFKIFDAAKQAGWHKEGSTRVDHVGLGLVLGEEGTKFKTRSGDTVKLVDLLDEAEERALAELVTRAQGGAASDESEQSGSPKAGSPKAGNAPSAASAELAAQLRPAAAKIGTAAVRYFDLRQSRTTSYKFDYDKMLNPKGNTAVYLYYAYARICSILRKAPVEVTLDTVSLRLEKESERKLALELLKFPDMLLKIADGDFQTHMLPDYIWELCNKLTSFYVECRVVGSPEMQSRLALCLATKIILRQSFELLGFEPLEQL